MKRALLVPAMVGAGVLLGVVLHDAAAAWMIEEGMAGVLLGMGTGAQPPGALLALLFVALRIFGTPLAGAAIAAAIVHAASAALRSRSPSRRGTRGSREPARPRSPTPR